MRGLGRVLLAAALLLSTPSGTEAMEPPPPNPRAAYSAAGPDQAAPELPPLNPLLEQAAPSPADTRVRPVASEPAAAPSPGNAAFPFLAKGLRAPPPNPLRGRADAPAPAAETPAVVASLGPFAPPPRPGRIPARPPEGAALLGKGLMLLGIFGSEDAPRAILRLPSGAVHRVSSGQTVSGITITRIANGAVSVRAGEAASTLRMP